MCSPRARGRIGTGFIGIPALLPALVQLGGETAASLFLQEGSGLAGSGQARRNHHLGALGRHQADGSVFDPP